MLDLPYNYDDLIEHLKKNKYKKLGNGIFGMVWECPDGSAIKFFQDDSAYENYVKYCRRCRNEHVPVFYTGINKRGDYFWIKMEKLSKKNFSKRNSVAYKLRQKINYGKNSKIFEKYPKLIKIVKWVQNSEWDCDLHTGNVMMRGETPVIIDPVV